MEVFQVALNETQQPGAMTLSGFISKTLKTAVALLCVAVMLTSCATTPGSNPPTFTTFHQIPGVTQGHIQAIEALRQQYDYFTYGMMANDEMIQTQHGEIIGFAPQMAQWLSGLFGIPFKPVALEWTALIDGLADGTVHFTGQLTRNPERELTYTMTDPIALRSLSLMRNPATAPDISALPHPPRFIFYKGTVTADILADSGAFEAFDRIYVTYPEEVIALLVAGEAEGFIGDGVQTLSLAFPQFTVETLYPYVFGTRSFSAQGAHLAPIVEVVQLALENGGMDILSDLYAQGLADFQQYRISRLLNQPKQDFIQHAPPIYIAAQTDGYPVSFWNPFEHEFQGIAHDVLAAVAQNTGLEFRIYNQPSTSLDGILQMLCDGDVSLVVGLVTPEEVALCSDVFWTEAFYSDTFALLSRTEFRQITPNEVLFTSVGMVEGSVHHSRFKSLFTQGLIHTTYFANLDALLHALESEAIDMAFSSFGGLALLTNFHETTGFRANLIFDETYNVSIATTDPMLGNVIDTILGVIDTQSITNYWMNRTFDYSRQVLQLRLQTMLPIALGSAILLAFALFWISISYRSRRKERKRLEAVIDQRNRELEMEAAMLSTILDSLPDILFCKDTDLRLLRINSKYSEFFGLAPEVFLGKQEQEVFPELQETVDTWYAVDRKVIDQQKEHKAEEIIPDQNGELRIFEAIKRPLVFNGRSIGLVGIARDITKRKQLEEELIKASEAKTAFLANMSHEIRTPMNSIVGFSELALQEKISPKAQRYMHHVIENAGRLLQIINDILDVSKIESGKLELEQAPFDFEDIFEKCRSEMSIEASVKGLDVNFHNNIVSPGRSLVGDALRLQQIFTNLLTNAQKFTHSGKINVSANLVSATENTKTIICEIADTGIGMTAEQVARISEPFMQADASVTRRYGGTGLGIPIVKNLVEIMGGQLGIESEVGVGSKFSFQLTFDTIDQSDIKEEKHAYHVQPIFKGDVLVCEDNPMNQMVITDHLARVGITAAIAENGLVGVEMVRRHMKECGRSYDLIFMDTHMPVMGGLEAVTEINKIGNRAPIVALTANVMVSDRETYMRYGMVGCIKKPFTTIELWDCLTLYLEKVGESTEGLPAENSQQLLLRLQSNFVRENQDKFEEIMESVRAKDGERTYRLLHTLKSTAALIDMGRLQGIAEELETALYKGERIMEYKWSLLKMELKQVLQDLEYLRPRDSLTQSNYSTFEDLAKDLQPLLSSRNPKAIDFVEDVLLFPQGEALAKLIEGYDFRQALALMNELLNTH